MMTNRKSGDRSANDTVLHNGLVKQVVIHQEILFIIWHENQIVAQLKREAISHGRFHGTRLG